MTGLDDQETKTAAYWSTPFKTICLGMNVSGDLKWLGLNMLKTSLHILIAPGHYTASSKDKDNWKALIAGSRLQTDGCKKQGINVKCGKDFYTRIGLLANDDDECDSCDSGIMFGGFGKYYYANALPEPNVCGNICGNNNDDGDRNTKANGYILVR